MSLLEQDITKKEQVDEMTSQIEFDNGKGKSDEYKVEAICNSTVYARESKRDHLQGLYYLILW